jgi:hypothetical protein
MSRYLHAEDWEHIFEENGPAELVRFVWDCETGAIVALEHRASTHRGWENAMGWQDCLSDVTEEMRNFDMTASAFGSGGPEDPAEFGMEISDELPAWAAAGQAASPSP